MRRIRGRKLVGKIMNKNRNWIMVRHKRHRE
jgi:hypothetical protein